MNILQIQDDLKNLSDQQLVGEMKMPSGTAPQYLVMGEMQRRARMRQSAQAAQMQPARTVAEDLTEGAEANNEMGIAALAQRLPQQQMTAAPMQGMSAPGMAAPGPAGQVPGMRRGGAVRGYAMGGDIASNLQEQTLLQEQLRKNQMPAGIAAIMAGAPMTGMSRGPMIAPQVAAPDFAGASVPMFFGGSATGGDPGSPDGTGSASAAADAAADAAAAADAGGNDAMWRGGRIRYADGGEVDWSGVPQLLGGGQATIPYEQWLRLSPAQRQLVRPRIGAASFGGSTFGGASYGGGRYGAQGTRELTTEPVPQVSFGGERYGGGTFGGNRFGGYAGSPVRDMITADTSEPAMMPGRSVPMQGLPQAGPRPQYPTSGGEGQFGRDVRGAFGSLYDSYERTFGPNREEAERKNRIERARINNQPNYFLATSPEEYAAQQQRQRDAMDAAGRGEIAEPTPGVGPAPTRDPPVYNDGARGAPGQGDTNPWLGASNPYDAAGEAPRARRPGLPRSVTTGGGGIAALPGSGGPGISGSVTPQIEKERPLSEYAAEFNALRSDRLGPYEARLAEAQADVESERKSAGWLALARAGLGIAASRNPTLLGSIAEGGLPALNAYEAQKAANRKEVRDLVTTGANVASVRQSGDDKALELGSNVRNQYRQDALARATLAQNRELEGRKMDVQISHNRAMEANASRNQTVEAANHFLQLSPEDQETLNKRTGVNAADAKITAALGSRLSSLERSITTLTGKRGEMIDPKQKEALEGSIAQLEAEYRRVQQQLDKHAGLPDVGMPAPVRAAGNAGWSATRVN